MGPLAVLVAALAATPASGQSVSSVVSGAPDAAAVTVYRLGYALDSQDDVRLDEADPSEGLAMIRETRTVDLPAGRSRVSFRGVADTMVPQTAAVEGLPGAVLERNEDYNLLTPGALAEAAVGQTVQLVRTNPKTGEVTARPAVVRSSLAGPILEVDGRFEALGCSGLPERVVFDRVPPGLADKPTFSVLTDVSKAGRYKVALSYLATGMAWSADYVARIAPDGRSLDLTGWITLANQTSASFKDAPTDVVAGELSHDEETVPPDFGTTGDYRQCWPGSFRPPPPPPPAPPAYARGFGGGGGADGVEEIVVTARRIAKLSELGDYKLYTLPEPTTVAARQTKQVLFLEQKGAPFERVYSYRHDYDDYRDPDEQGAEPATVLLRLKNETRAGLGKPLPAGKVTVMEPGERGLVLAGQRKVADTPVGLPLEVELGRAMDVSVAVTLVEDDDAKDETRATIEVTVLNDKPVPIAFEYRQIPQGDGFKVRHASRTPGTKNGDAFWVLRVPAGGQASLRYEMSWPD